LETHAADVWTKNGVVWKKAVQRRLPFFVLGWSSDNGGEVMNDRMYGYLSHKGILIYRGRPYQKIRRSQNAVRAIDGFT